MDINMPGMSGTEATHALRRRDPAFAVPVIAVTAGLTATQRDACLAAGFACILLKPLEYGELVATLARLAA
jgi:CheY-like chemotaxis protein